MPNHQIPLFLSNDPEQVDEVSEDGSRFTIRLTPPIVIPARRLDGSNVVPTISARSIDIINSMHNVSLQHKNHEFLIGWYDASNTQTPSLIHGTALMTIENGIYSLEELYAAINSSSILGTLNTLLTLPQFDLTLAPLSTKNRVQLTINNANYAIIVTPDTIGLPPLSIGTLGNTTCKQTMTISCSCHSFNFVDEKTHTNIITLSNAAMALGNTTQGSPATPTELIEKLTIPNTTTQAIDGSYPKWSDKHVAIKMKNGKFVSSFNSTDLTKARFVTNWVALKHRLDKALTYTYHNLSTHGGSIPPIGTLVTNISSNVLVYQDARGDFLGIEIYLSFFGETHDNMISGNTHYTMCSLDGEAIGSSELLCTLNDTFDETNYATMLLLGANLSTFKIPYLLHLSPPTTITKMTFDSSDPIYTHCHPRAFVHVTSASRLMSMEATPFESRARNTSATSYHTQYFYPPYPITLGNQFGKLLGLYELNGGNFVYQNVGGAYNTGDVTTFVAKGAAQFDHASTLHLSCSLANGSISSDGHGARGIICSWPMSQVAQGAHASIMYSTPIKVPCRMAGMHTDRITFQVTDVVGERPHLSGERLLLNVVIEYDT